LSGPGDAESDPAQSRPRYGKDTRGNCQQRRDQDGTDDQNNMLAEQRQSFID
jgi:hypothetical protein